MSLLKKNVMFSCVLKTQCVVETWVVYVELWVPDFLWKSICCTEKSAIL